MELVHSLVRPELDADEFTDRPTTWLFFTSLLWECYHHVDH